MSSHHIVREKQEPALLVLDAEGFSAELLGQLLEWSPTVIASAAAAEKLASMGIKVDRIIADSAESLNQPDVKPIPTGNNIPAVAALKFLIDNGYPSVNIIAQTNPESFEAYIDKIILVIYTTDKRIYPVRTGFSKWKPAGEAIEIYGTGYEPHCNGLKKNAHGKYITEADGFFSINFDEPFLFLAEAL